MKKNLCKIYFFVQLFLVIEKSFCWSRSKDLFYDKLGQLGLKEFYIPKLQTVQWHEARRLCEEFDMEFARLELQSEADYIMSVAAINDTEFAIFVDGVTATPGQKTGWFWGKTRDPVSYTMKWIGTEPNNELGEESCLEIDNKYGKVGFSDTPCSSKIANFAKLYMCQISNTISTYKN